MSRCCLMLGLVLLLSGCVPSLHPLYTDKDLVFKPWLVGIWGGKEGQDQDLWIFEKSAENAYTLTILEKGVAAKFDAHLLLLEETLFLDIFPQQPVHPHGYYAAHLFRAHSFYKVTLREDSLRLAFLDPDWLKKTLEESKVQIAHEQMEDNILLTASTRELQKFVLKYLADEEAWKAGDEMTRRK